MAKIIGDIKIDKSISDRFKVEVNEIDDDENCDALTEVILTDKKTKEKKEIHVNNVQGKLQEVVSLNGFIWYNVKKADKCGKKKKVTEGTISMLKLNGVYGKYIKSAISDTTTRVCTFKGCILIGERCKETNSCLCSAHRNGTTAMERKLLLVTGLDQGENPNVGSATEEFIIDILKTCPDVKSVEWTAFANGPFDVLYTLKDEVQRGLQIKTLTEYEFQDNFNISKTKTSHNDLLYVCVNKNRTRFVVIDGKHVGGKHAGFAFNSHKAKHAKFMFKDLETFKKELFISLKDSTKVTEEIFEKSLGTTQLLEYQSVKRCDEKCKDHNLTLVKCCYPQYTYDVTINNKKIQCKFSSEKSVFKIRFHLHKASEGKRYQPYEENDFDFVMLESSYDKGNFYIIPQSELLKHKFLKTKDCSGRVRLSVDDQTNEENEDKTDWTTEYYNNFDLLK